MPCPAAGNLQDVGLLPLGPGGCLVELGAGKGFLGVMIAEAAKIERILLVDCRVCFKNKVGHAGRRARPNTPCTRVDPECVVCR